jgi:hypothetical protein
LTISQREFEKLSDDKKFAVVYRHTLLTEEAIGRLEAAIYELRDKVAKMETASAENAPKPSL